jgi:hypothetical protein
MRFLRGSASQSAVEWLVVAMIIVGVVGGMIWSIHISLAEKLEAYNETL